MTLYSGMNNTSGKVITDIDHLRQTRLGRDIRRSAIFAALHVEGVQRVELASPLADVVLNKTQAASCTQWSVTNGGTDE